MTITTEELVRIGNQDEYYDMVRTNRIKFYQNSKEKVFMIDYENLVKKGFNPKTLKIIYDLKEFKIYGYTKKAHSGDHYSSLEIFSKEGEVFSEGSEFSFCDSSLALIFNSNYKDDHISREGEWVKEIHEHEYMAEMAVNIVSKAKHSVQFRMGDYPVKDLKNLVNSWFTCESDN